MKKLLVSFLIALLVLLLAACNTKPASNENQTPNSKPDVGTTSDTTSKDETKIDSEPEGVEDQQGNTPPKKEEEQKPIVNNKIEFNDFIYSDTKFLTFSGDNIYFRGEDGTYRVSKNGGAPVKITSFYGNELNVLNNNLFLKVNPESAVDNITEYEMRYLQYNLKTNGFKTTNINGSKFKFYNDKLIFFSAGQVYTANLDGSNAKPITSTEHTGNFIIYNNQIYYISGYFVYDYVAQESKAYFILNLTDLEGKKIEKLFEVPSGDFIIVNDKIVVRDEEKIRIMDIEGNKIDEFETGLSYFSQMNYFNNKLYVLSGGTLYSFDFDGGNKKVISDSVSYFEINESKLYCYNNGKICKYNLDGSAKEIIV